MSNLPQATQIVNFGEIEVIFTNAAYLNATAIAKHFGKRVQHYLDSERTQDYIMALSEAVKTASQNLVIIKKGNSKNFEQGTWLHPKLAIDFARWLNPKFAVWCDEQIEKLLNLDDNARPTKTTAHDRTTLISACTKLSAGYMNISDVYKMVGGHFGYDDVVSIPAPLLPQAVAFVYEMILAKGSADFKFYNESDERNALWKVIGIVEYERVSDELRRLQDTLDSAYSQLQRINSTKGLIFDAIKEQTTHCPYNPDRVKQAYAFIHQQMSLKRI